MWFKVDDKMHAHRKTRRALRSHPAKRLDAAPFGIWVLAGSWVGDNDNTGWIPEFELERFDDEWETLAERLVDAGYWWPEERDGEGGYGFVNFEEYNPAFGASDSGTFGNHVRWHVNRGKVDEACSHCPKEPDSHPEPTPPASGRIAPRSGPDIAPESPPESETIANPSPNPIPDPDPSPSLRSGGAGGDTPPSRDLALVDNPHQTAPADADAKPNKRGTRIPDDWQPARTKGNIEAEEGHTPEWLRNELAKFRDYWTAKTGQSATKLDWQATWRNWIRNANDFQKPRNNQPRTAASMTEADWNQIMADARARDEAEARRTA